MNVIRFRLPKLKKIHVIFLLQALVAIVLFLHLDFDTIVISVDKALVSKKLELRAIKLAEYKYKDKLSELSEGDITELTEYYHRDVKLHWSSLHGILPQSKPIPDISCLRHLDQDFRARVSVVMCMKNELIYLLLRTLTTLVKRTPPHLLGEILLIDDGSDTDSSEEILSYSAQLNIPIKILRNNVSVGITNCRNYGIRQAHGEVLVILDTHMEVSDLWLEPLLDILQSKPNAIAVPTMQLINEKDYDEEHLLISAPYGIEMMNGYSFFRYYPTGPPERNQSAAYPTSSILGGALAAHRRTFLEYYPRGIYPEYWGTENSRLALRMWLCGEGLWMTRCSQILHTNGNDGGLKRYTKDSPDMWLHLHYETLGDVMNFISEEGEKRRMLYSVYREDKHIESILNVSRVIAQQFNSGACSHDYAWYLNNRHPRIHYLQFRSTDKYSHVGEAQSVSHPVFCIMADNKKIYVEKNCRKDKTIVFDTHLLGFSRKGEVHTTVQVLNCWDASGNGRNESGIIMYGCHARAHPELETTYSSQRFEYDETTQQIRHVTTNRCAQIFPEQMKVLLVYCNDRLDQKWNINKPRWT